jgi:ribosome-associated protein
MTEKALTMTIKDDYITLGQFVKHFHLIKTGGEEKAFLATHDITVNGEKEIRRGRKLHPNDQIVIDGKNYQVCSLKA